MNFQSTEWQREHYKNKNNDIINIVVQKELKDIRKGKKRYEIKNQDISYKNAETLTNVYHSIDKDNIAEKESFILCLLEALREKKSDSYEEDRYVGSTGLLYISACKLGYSLQATLYLVTNDEDNIATLVPMLLKILKCNIKYFSSKELGYIQNKLSTIQYYEETSTEIERQELNDQITDLRFENLEGKTQGIVIEINNDKKQVLEYLKDFGFNKRYNIALNDIDKYINSDQEIQLSSAICSFREFYKDFYTDLAQKIAEFNENEDIPILKDKEGKEMSEIYCATMYIKKKFNLGRSDTSLLKSYLGLTNSEGAHKLVSEKKYFRLTRNIGIEIALFMLLKFEDYKKIKGI